MLHKLNAYIIFFLPKLQMTITACGDDEVSSYKKQQDFAIKFRLDFNNNATDCHDFALILYILSYYLPNAYFSLVAA